MECIKKEDLKEGDIFVTQLSYNNFLNKYGTGFSLNLKTDNSIKNETLYKGGGFAYDNMRLATPEEKHWLESCITADKFITFEETMETFIPEYVEWINNIGSENLGYQTKYTFEKNKIFKTDTELPLAGFQTENWLKHLTVYTNNYKPSTKEAYDAQFIIKEPEFVLPEKWCIKVTDESRDIININRNKIGYGNISIIYKYATCFNYAGNYDIYGTEITFEQFKKYVLKEETVEEKVIEPLPQFKVIETIETITKVENNEGNQFFIDDRIKTPSANIYNIKGFKYNVDKTNILAILSNDTRIGIDKIEHYIEPKVVEPFISLPFSTITKGYEESLLEKAKRLYPVGTVVKSVGFYDLKTIKTNDFKETVHTYTGKVIYADKGFTAIYSEQNNKWAEIIKYSHGFKIGDKIKIKTTGDLNIYEIINIEGNVLFYKFQNSFTSIQCRVLAKNAIKVN